MLVPCCVESFCCLLQTNVAIPVVFCLLKPPLTIVFERGCPQGGLREGPEALRNFGIALHQKSNGAISSKLTYVIWRVTTSHVLCSYAHAHARIVLKFFLVVRKYVDILSFEFAKNRSRGCGEIDVLLALYVFITDAHVLCCYVRARARIDLKFFLVVREYG